MTYPCTCSFQAYPFTYPRRLQEQGHTADLSVSPQGPAARNQNRQPASDDIREKDGNVGPSMWQRSSRLDQDNAGFTGQVSMSIEDNPA